MQQQVIQQPRRRPVRSYDLRDLARVERECAYRQSGRQGYGSAPNEQIGSSAPFVPTDVAGLLGWFDMQDAASYTNASGACSAITNKASSFSYTQGTAGNRPTINATGLNGFPCLDADGTNDTLIGAEAAVASGLANANPYTLLIVAQADDLAIIEVIFGVAHSGFTGPGAKRWGINSAGAGRWAMIGTDDASAAITFNSSVTNQTITTPCVLEWYTDSAGTTSFFRLNGGATIDSFATAHGTLTPDRAALFCRAGATLASHFDGRFGELLLYNSDIGSTARNAARGYLGTKWGITV